MGFASWDGGHGGGNRAKGFPVGGDESPPYGLPDPMWGIAARCLVRRGGVHAARQRPGIRTMPRAGCTRPLQPHGRVSALFRLRRGPHRHRPCPRFRVSLPAFCEFVLPGFGADRPVATQYTRFRVSLPTFFAKKVGYWVDSIRVPSLYSVSVQGMQRSTCQTPSRQIA